MTSNRHFALGPCLPYIVASAIAMLMTVIVAPSSGLYFRRFVGDVPPLLAVCLASVVGAGALVLLRGRGGFQVSGPGRTGRGIAVSAVVATILGLEIAIADIFIRYPENTNVPVPEALLFYPAIGFVAEIAFHIVPLTIVLLLLWPLRKRVGPNRIVWAAIVFTAVAEPTFQVVFGGAGWSWTSAYTWVHVGAIASLQLVVFRRYGFLSMLVFRLIYYAYWHIIWGVIRLEVLF